MSNQARSWDGLNGLRVPHDYPTIQEAIDAALGGSLIEVDRGSYPENLRIQKPLRLKGYGAILKADPQRPAVSLRDAGAITLEGFRIQSQSEGRGADTVGVLIQGRTQASLLRNELQGWGISIRVQSGASAVLEENILQTDVAAQEVVGISLEGAEAEILSNQIHIGSSWEYVFGVSASASKLRMAENTITLLVGSREVAAALLLVNSQGEVAGNRIVARRAEGVLIDGSQGLTLKGNHILADSTGIDLRRSLPEDHDAGRVRIQGNSIFGQLRSSKGIVVDSLQVTIEDNIVGGHKVGILFGFGGQGELKGNLVVGNQEDGVIIQRDAARVLLHSNQILSNGGCGVRIEGALQKRLAIEGEENWIAGNRQGDLCPEDYPWPEGFKAPS